MDTVRHEDLEEVLETLDLGPGDIVADVGAGSGYFTLPLARAVWPGGLVWALDVDQVRVEHVAGRASALPEGDGVLAERNGADTVGLAEGVLDTALLAHVDIVVEAPAQASTRALLASLVEALRPGGRVVVVQWLGDRPIITTPIIDNLEGAGLRVEALWMDEERNTVHALAFRPEEGAGR